MAGRGKKLKYEKNARAHEEWQAGKKLGRKKQKWVVDMPERDTDPIGKGHWEKI